MAKVAAKYKVPVVVMHNQDGTDYSNMVEDVKGFFKESIRIAKEAGVPEELLILDPGIGFGKTSEQNIEMMSKLDEIKAMGYPVLLGTSRKTFIGSILDLPPKERGEGTIATTVLGIAQGVDIVRVHDVSENLRAAMVVDANLYLDLGQAGKTDDLNYTVSYAEVYTVLENIMLKERYDLLEALAHRICDEI